MADTVSLTCPSCGSRLQVTSDLERFACGHCGNELVVRRGGGIVSLAPVVEGLDRVAAGVAQVRSGVDRTASELALVRLEKEADVIREEVARIRPHGNTWMGIIVLIGLLLMVSPIADGDGGMATGGVLLAGIGALLLWLEQRRVRARKQPYYERIDSIYEEIERHRELLRSR